MIVEPLVQGAAGMLVHPTGYLRAVRELCDEHGVLLICDEVATGFGRTGHDVRLRAGGRHARLHVPGQGPHRRLPAARRDADDRARSTRASSARYEELRTFFHGHTYTGNPLACAAALATLDVFEEERTLDAPAGEDRAARRRCSRARRAAAGGRRGPPARLHDRASSSTASRSPTRMGHQVTLAARARGAIIRPLGDVVVLMPPLSITRPTCGGSSRSPPTRSPRRRRPSLDQQSRPARRPAAPPARRRVRAGRSTPSPATAAPASAPAATPAAIAATRPCSGRGSPRTGRPRARRR